jgi:hypothetical protein
VWGPATFVASEITPTTGEGIYVWDPPVWMTEDYFPGFADLPILDYESVSPGEFPSLPVGFRGDYQFALQDRPFLYVSSVDCRLHLVKSKAGIWNIDGSSEIRYANLDGDDYLDQWLYLKDGEPQRQLDATLDYLVYAGENRVILKQVSLEPALLTTLPPSSQDEWLALGRSLEQFSCPSAPKDFSAMVARLEGPEWHVQGAQMRDFRPDGRGFRFVLELQPGYHVVGSSGPEIEGLSAQTYVVSYHGMFDVQPLTPAQPHIVPDSVRLGQEAAIALEPTRITASLYNAGLADLPELWVQAYARGPQEPPRMIGETSVTLLGGESRPFFLDWTPPAAGMWQITLVWGVDKAELPDVAFAATSFRAEVRAPQTLDVGSIWRMSNVRDPGLLLILLISVGLAAAGLTTIVIRLVVGA